MERESFGYWLKRQRTAQALTRADLARLVGCAIITLRKIEGDTLRPSQQMAARLVEALGVSPHAQPTLIAVARSAPSTHYPNLPTPLTALLGRAEQIATVCDLLRGPTRLLTLTGTGGIGKTRLAIQVATLLLDDFADGAFFVDLAPLHDPDLVLPTIAKVLHVREQPTQPLLDLLAQELSDQQILLVLDNLEQLLPCAPQIAALLLAVPGLKVLATSRAILHLAGESVFVVPPLGLPSAANLHATDLSPADLLDQSPAVALFVARAQAATASFALTLANAASVAAICTRLDGLPLAIDLAAARCRLFAPAALLTRLEHRLSLLTHGAQDLPARQQTLRATIDWSYALLSEAGRALFRRLAIFTGGCTILAAEHVCIEPTALARADSQNTILTELETLLDHSLIAQHEGADGEPRFGMLETIREYALEQLIISGELPALRSRYNAYYLALAAAAEPQLEGGAEPTVWMQRLDAEHDNLHSIVMWGLAPGGDPALALQLAGRLWLFWRVRGYLRQGRAWFTSALAAAPAQNQARALALKGAGFLARCEGDLIQAETLLQQSVALYRSFGDRRGTAHALNYLGTIAVDRSNYQQARAHCSECLDIAHELGDTFISGLALRNLGDVARWDMDYLKAMRLYEQGLTLLRANTMMRGIGLTLWSMSRTAFKQHDYHRASALAEESQALFRELGDKFGMAAIKHILADIAQAEGDDARALALCAESMALFRALDDKRHMAWVLTSEGLVAELHGDLPAAYACYRQSRQLYKQAGDPTGLARSICGLSMLAMIEGNGLAAHALLEVYTTLMQNLGQRRKARLGACLRDAALATVDWPRSVALLERSLNQFRTTGDQWGECFALRILGQTLIGAHAHAQAQEYIRAGLARASALDDQIGMLIQLAGLATIALRTGAIAYAAWLCGAIETMQATLGIGYVAASMWPPDRAQYARTHADLRGRLGDPTLAAAWAAGSALSTAAAITATLAFMAEPQPAVCYG